LGSAAASWIAFTMCAGVGVSGSPTPKLITSTPAARFAEIFLSISANRYGGRLSIRPASFTRSSFRRCRFGEQAREARADRPLERLFRGPAHVYGRVGPFDVERPSRKVDRDSPARIATEVSRDGNGACRRPTRRRLTDAT